MVRIYDWEGFGTGKGVELGRTWNWERFGTGKVWDKETKCICGSPRSLICMLSYVLILVTWLAQIWYRFTLLKGSENETRFIKLLNYETACTQIH